MQFSKEFPLVALVKEICFEISFEVFEGVTGVSAWSFMKDIQYKNKALTAIKRI